MKKKKIIIITGLLIISFSFQFKTLARYTSNTVWNYYLKSHGFYMSSDNLNDNQKNINTLWDGSSTHFNIKNNLNLSQITEYDIKYNVKCEILNDIDATCKLMQKESQITGVLSSDASCKNNKNDNIDTSGYNKTQCELNDYTWQNDAMIQDLYFDIIPKEETDIDYVSVKITLESIEPYKKTLTGIFDLYKNTQDLGSIIKTVKDNNDYDELIITNSYNQKRCVNITFDSTKRIVELPENARDIQTDSAQYINKFKIDIKEQSNQKIIFYNKEFQENYTIDDFIVEEIGC